MAASELSGAGQADTRPVTGAVSSALKSAVL